MAYSFLLIPLCIGLVESYGYGYGQSGYHFDNHKYCDDLSPYYGEINLDRISGVWYGVEKIPHTKGEYKIEHTRECFYIDIKELDIEKHDYSGFSTNIRRLLIVFLILPAIFAANVNFCQNLNPTHDFDEEALLGMWYIHEYIFHRDNQTKTDYNPNCPIIQLRKFEDYVHGGLINRNLPTPSTPYPTLTNAPYMNRQYGIGLPEQYRIRHFVLEWHEGLWQDDYHIKVNTSHKGFWPTDVPYGSVDKMYRFFGGVIQVLKVANNHLVLNFCMRLPNSQLYSVVLSRNENQLTPEDLASIHNVFTMKHLSTSALKRVCENAAPSFTVSYILLFIICISLWKSFG